MVATTTILIAEDEADDVFFLRRAFQKAGLAHQICSVRDGQEALEYLTGQPPYSNRAKYPMPDLVLLDIKMPRMGGLEVLAWIRSNPHIKELPVVILTSSDRAEDRRQAAALGASYYKVKPQDVLELVEFAREIDAQYFRQPAAAAA